MLNIKVIAAFVAALVLLAALFILWKQKQPEILPALDFSKQPTTIPAFPDNKKASSDNPCAGKPKPCDAVYERAKQKGLVGISDEERLRRTIENVRSGMNKAKEQ